MREIKFRGIDIKTGIFVYGSHQHVIRKGRCELIIDWDSNISYEIIPKTLGQYTGVLDKNGIAIYEGDILDTSKDWSGKFNPVVWEKVHSGHCTQFSHGFTFPFTEYKVIGNIYQNKELLK